MSRRITSFFSCLCLLLLVAAAPATQPVKEGTAVTVLRLTLPRRIYAEGRMGASVEVTNLTKEKMLVKNRPVVDLLLRRPDGTEKDYGPFNARRSAATTQSSTQGDFYDRGLKIVLRIECTQDMAPGADIPAIDHNGLLEPVPIEPGKTEVFSFRIAPNWLPAGQSTFKIQLYDRDKLIGTSDERKVTVLPKRPPQVPNRTRSAT